MLLSFAFNYCDAKGGVNDLVGQQECLASSLTMLKGEFDDKYFDVIQIYCTKKERIVMQWELHSKQGGLEYIKTINNFIN